MTTRMQTKRMRLAQTPHTEQTPRCTQIPNTAPYGAFENDAVGWMAPQKDYAGLVTAEQPMLRRTLRGKLDNADTWVAA